MLFILSDVILMINDNFNFFLHVSTTDFYEVLLCMHQSSLFGANICTLKNFGPLHL